MIDGLCQAYHWSFGEALKLTLPQIIMLNHGAHVNEKRADERYQWKKEHEEKLEANPVVWHGKRVTELSTEEYMSYFTSTEGN